MHLSIILANATQSAWKFAMSESPASPLRRLLREAARQPMLDAEQERDLARRAGDGDDAAAGALVSSHMRMVVKIAKRYRGHGLPISDLIQEGAPGLMQAVRRFNPERDTRLSTYAMWWIRAAIQDHVARSWSMVRVGTTKAQRSLGMSLRQMKGEISEELAARLAGRFNISAADVAATARRLAGDLSLDLPAGGGDGETWLDRLACARANPEAALDRRRVIELISRALQALSAREQLVIRRRYLDEARQTLEAVGRELGVSKARVRQIEVRALARLRELLSPALSGASA